MSAAGLDEGMASGGPLGWLHYNVILASRNGYPLPLMIGFTLYGNIMLRRESQGKRYPSWMLGWPVGLIVYTYPASVFAELMMQGITPRVFGNDRVLFFYTFWHFVIQRFDKFYEACCHKYVFIFLTAWWLADATRYALLTMERCVTQTPTLGKGIWTAFFWCGIVMIVRVMELTLRGFPARRLEDMVPNTPNVLKSPLLTMWTTMVLYLLYLAYGTDCDIFSKDGINAIECGNQNETVYAFATYMASIIHIARGFYMLNVGGKEVFGDMLCLGCAPGRQSHPLPGPSSDLEQPLLQKKK